ncbi:MAG TPA: FtsQ-type POTRA domain-containing protein [Solirubrobacteraceae bacterium]|jgi:cell division protein FtsQ|nr:FtsQ-type POTRA domain-containing protein [Solirubrobacteraceae bacterium]
MELSLPFPRRLPSHGARRGAAGKARRGGGSTAYARQALRRLSGNRLALRATVVLLLALPLFGGGWLWLRGSSLVAVEHVHISGVHGPDAIEIRAALEDSAKRMTTMDFSAAALRSAVASYAIVAEVRVKTSFPHTVSISVSERPPVAVLVSAGQRTAVAADGTVLGPDLSSGSLPSVSGSVEPAPGHRLGESAALAAVTVLGVAPAPLARNVARVYEGPEGLTAAMRSGLLVYFGNDTRPHAKWLSLARVLVSPSSAGALYVDVRLPERPAAGFSTSSSSSSTSAASSQTGSCPSGCASEPTAAALAASLASAVGGGTPSSGASTSESESATKESESSSTAAESSTQGDEADSSSVAGAPSSSASGSSEASTSASTEASAGSGGSG